MGTNENELITVRQFVSQYQWPSEAALRTYIHKAAEIGIQEAFLRVGRRMRYDAAFDKA